jgi:hypothetical protein
MLNENVVYIGFLFSLAGVVSYLTDTIRGKARPNRISWFFWALAPLIAFSAEIQKGVGIQSLMTFSVGFGPLIIFIASFANKKSYWKLEKRDYLYGLLAAIGLVLWKITGEGNIAIFFSILADGLASIPTVIKSYTNPESESANAFFLSFINASLTILTIKTWTFAHWGFPIYILLIDAILFVLIKFKIGVRKTHI